MLKFNRYNKIRNKEFHLSCGLLFSYYKLDNIYSSLCININNSPNIMNYKNYYIYKDLISYALKKITKEYSFDNNILILSDNNLLNLEIVLVSTNNLLNHLSYYLNTILNLEINNALILDYINYIKRKSLDIKYISKNKIVKNLYFNSSMKNYKYPLIDEINDSTFNDLNSFIKIYFNINNLNIVYASNDEEKNISEYTKILNNNLLKYKVSLVEELKIKYSEDYDKVYRNISSDKFYINNSYVSYAIKFPKQEIFVNKYGSFIYAYTYLLNNIFFKSNSFKHFLFENNANLYNSNFYYDENDFFLSIFLSCKVTDKTIQLINEYTNTLKNSLTYSSFKQEKNKLSLKLYEKLLSPYDLTTSISYPLNKIIPYQRLIQNIDKANYNSFLDFLDEIPYLPKSAYVARSNLDDN